MSITKKIEAIRHWNNAAAQFQNLVDANGPECSNCQLHTDALCLNDRSALEIRENVVTENASSKETFSQLHSSDHPETRIMISQSETGFSSDKYVQNMIEEDVQAIKECPVMGQTCDQGHLVKENIISMSASSYGTSQCDQSSTSGTTPIGDTSSLLCPEVPTLSESSNDNVFNQATSQLYSDSGGQFEIEDIVYRSDATQDNVYGYSSYAEELKENPNQYDAQDLFFLDDKNVAIASADSTTVPNGKAQGQFQLFDIPFEQIMSKEAAQIPSLASSHFNNTGQSNIDSNEDPTPRMNQHGHLQDYNTYTQPGDILNCPQMQHKSNQEYLYDGKQIVYMNASVTTSTTDARGDHFKNDNPSLDLESIHISDHDNSCHLCGKSGFSTKGNLKRHLKAHNGEKPFQCDVCETKFTEKKSLKIHLRKHTGEKPYKCEKCDKVFSQTGVLKLHMAIHNEKRKFECQKCDKTFRQRSQLNLHVMRHEGVKNLGCSKCDAKFLTKGDLERHFRTHTGERPYACEYCGKTFTRQQSLNEHLNRHIGRKPHTCKQCGKSFADTSALYKVRELVVVH